MGISRDCPIFWRTPIISERVNTTNFKFCTLIHGIDRNRSPLKMSHVITGRTARCRCKSRHI